MRRSCSRSLRAFASRRTEWSQRNGELSNSSLRTGRTAVMPRAVSARAASSRNFLFLPSTVPLVDDLIVVRHDEQVLRLLARDQAKDLVLGEVGVLELVNAQVAIHGAQLACDGRPAS